MATVDHVPPEILIQVFLHAAREAYSDFAQSLALERRTYDRTTIAAPYAWIPLTHVSRLWRDVALTYPGLWTNVVLVSSTCTSEILQRSSNQPLALTCHSKSFTAFTGLQCTGTGQTNIAPGTCIAADGGDPIQSVLVN